MGILGSFQVNPFPWPKKPAPQADPVRGELNQLAKAITGHDDDATLHTVTTTTTGVTTSAVAIYATITGIAKASIEGTDGTNSFVDSVVWNGTTNIKAVISSTTLDAAPAARTYTVVSGVLKLQMASGTYTVVVVSVVFT